MALIPVYWFPFIIKAGLFVVNHHNEHPGWMVPQITPKNETPHCEPGRSKNCLAHQTGAEGSFARTATPISC